MFRKMVLCLALLLLVGCSHKPVQQAPAAATQQTASAKEEVEQIPVAELRLKLRSFPEWIKAHTNKRLIINGAVYGTEGNRMMFITWAIEGQTWFPEIDPNPTCIFRDGEIIAQYKETASISVEGTLATEKGRLVLKDCVVN